MFFSFYLLAFATPFIAHARSRHVSIALWLVYMILHTKDAYAGALGLLTIGIPTALGALYLKIAAKPYATSLKARLCLAALNLTAMVLFMTDAVGSSAWTYALYWIVPVAVILLPRAPLFARALGSTLTAHALGSLRTLWFGSLTATHWVALVPVVCVERLACTMAIVAGVYLLKVMIRHTQSLSTIPVLAGK